MRKKEKNKGITLIALVITIIVLLILAGISIATLTGENGVVKRAQDAKEQTEIGEEKEIISLAAMSARMENKEYRLEETEFRKALNNEAGEGRTNLADIGEEFEILFIDSGRFYLVGKDGKIEKAEVKNDQNPGNIEIGKDGEELKGDENKPFEIWCIEDLLEWSKNSNKYMNAHISLKKTLNFKEMSSYADCTRIDFGDINLDGNVTKLIDEMQTGIGFAGIASFGGTFEGENNEIRNIYMNSDKASVGFFNEISGAEIKNLSISGKIISTHNRAWTGGIVGTVNSTDNKIYNCNNLCDIEARNRLGGIAGVINATESKIVNCINYGRIYMPKSIWTGEGNYVTCGGIVGLLGNNKAINCCNFGIITNEDGKVYAGAGGIVGNQVTSNIIVENCFNQGKVTGKYSQGAMVGGFWYSNWKSSIVHSYYLKSSCNSAVGGISDTGTNIEVKSETEEYLKGKEFLNELNLYVTNYNKENKGNADFIELKNWIKGENGYPVLDI